MDLPRRGSERATTRAPIAARFLVVRPFRVGDSPNVTPAGATVTAGDVSPEVLSRLIQTGAAVDEVLIRAREAEAEANAVLERARRELGAAVDRAGALGGAAAVTKSTPVPSSATEREARQETIDFLAAQCAAAEDAARKAAKAVESAAAVAATAIEAREREETRTIALVASLMGSNTPAGEGA